MRTRTTDTGPALSGSFRLPALDFRTEPEHRPSRAEVDDRTGHVRVARLILADSVSVGETQDLGDVVSVDQVVDEDSSRHGKSLRRLADGVHTRKQFRPTLYVARLVEGKTSKRRAAENGSDVMVSK